MPTEVITSASFGGRNLEDLYVTTGTMGVDFYTGLPSDMTSVTSSPGGSIFVIKGLNAKGYPARRLNICRCIESKKSNC